MKNMFRGYDGTEPSQRALERAAELGRARQYLEGQAVTAADQEIVGDPADAIVEFADQSHADLIIVGTRDHRRLGRLFGQSVSETVSHHAHCDVLVVHERQR